ncbi:MAG: head-tail adaptor protein [Aliishimia sp.]
MSKIPHLNRRLSLDARGHLFDGAGGYEPLWSELGVHWAEVTPRSGRERQGKNAPLSNVGYKITVRSAPVGNPARPLPEQRFRDGNRIFHIKGVAESDQQGLYLTCFVEEEVVA